MSSASTPRVVLVTRPTEYDVLLARHATRAQARFFLRTRGQDIDAVEARHHAFEEMRRRVLGVVPVHWRRSCLPRGDLDRFLFEPGDLVVALGQDGLVANVAKYLEGQPVIGLNPDPERNPGVLVPHPPEAAEELLRIAAEGRAVCEERTMVEAELDDGQRLCALNEIFVGHASHQSARYEIAVADAAERQSSSGVIIATGTGGTGWARSINRERPAPLELPGPQDRRLAFYVREAWPSVWTGTGVTQGLLDEGEALTITSRMDAAGVVFGDGIEADRIEFSWGRRVTLRVAASVLRLVRAA
jgi:NAD kinase